MVCPRCERARIERDGVNIRCAVCGKYYDPNQVMTTRDPNPQTLQMFSSNSLSYETNAVVHN